LEEESKHNCRVFFFVLVRVISWIVLFARPKIMIHEITRTNTKRSNVWIRGEFEFLKNSLQRGNATADSSESVY
jgi:hypothetical protein